MSIDEKTVREWIEPIISDKIKSSKDVWFCLSEYFILLVHEILQRCKKEAIREGSNTITKGKIYPRIYVFVCVFFE